MPNNGSFHIGTILLLPNTEMSGPVCTKYKDIQLMSSKLYGQFRTVSELVILLAGLAMHQDVKLLNNNGNYVRNARLALSVGVELIGVVCLL
jgi:hypothetical protein